MTSKVAINLGHRLTPMTADFFGIRWAPVSAKASRNTHGFMPKLGGHRVPTPRSTNVAYSAFITHCDAYAST